METLAVTNRYREDGPDTVCRLDVLRDDPPLVMVTEIAANPGLSVTNAAERIAETLVGRFGPTVKIVEHYGPDSYEGGRRGPDTYDLVVWFRDRGDGQMAVRWRHLQVDGDQPEGIIKAITVLCDYSVVLPRPHLSRPGHEITAGTRKALHRGGRDEMVVFCSCRWRWDGVFSFEEAAKTHEQPAWIRQLARR